MADVELDVGLICCDVKVMGWTLRKTTNDITFISLGVMLSSAVHRRVRKCVETKSWYVLFILVSSKWSSDMAHEFQRNCSQISKKRRQGTPFFLISTVWEIEGPTPLLQPVLSPSTPTRTERGRIRSMSVFHTHDKQFCDVLKSLLFSIAKRFSSA